MSRAVEVQLARPAASAQDVVAALDALVAELDLRHYFKASQPLRLKILELGWKPDRSDWGCTGPNGPAYRVAIHSPGQTFDLEIDLVGDGK